MWWLARPAGAGGIRSAADAVEAGAGLDRGRLRSRSGSSLIIVGLLVGEPRRPGARDRPQGARTRLHPDRLRRADRASIAPLTEEFVFRGFLFTVLWERTNVPVATVVTGGRSSGSSTSRARTGSACSCSGVLGAVLCLLFWRTVSLIPCIVLHSFHNSISFGVVKELPWWGFLLLVAGSVTTTLAMSCSPRGSGRRPRPRRAGCCRPRSDARWSPAAASAQTPTPTPTPPAPTPTPVPTPPPPPPAPGHAAAEGRRSATATRAAPSRSRATPWRIRGELRPYVAGQTVLVRFFRHGRKHPPAGRAAPADPRRPGRDVPHAVPQPKGGADRRQGGPSRHARARHRAQRRRCG